MITYIYYNALLSLKGVHKCIDMEALTACRELASLMDISVITREH